MLNEYATFGTVAQEWHDAAEATSTDLVHRLEVEEGGGCSGVEGKITPRHEILTPG